MSNYDPFSPVSITQHMIQNQIPLFTMMQELRAVCGWDEYQGNEDRPYDATPMLMVGILRRRLKDAGEATLLR